MAILQGESWQLVNNVSQRARLEPGNLAVPLMRHLHGGLFILFPEA